ncbi:energy-coupling factor transporter transmembrane component T [uncultured Clostridium sp.]|uniref:energy-coupling factor transporter transmembrane component T n=1 Tax=uncultured Clostridium sp. TaxID=59620 RepID=UPI0026111E61|nr:energy-coupling factor transporter transmembrane component T [uncultured Clostridium sp.]
MDDKDWLFKKEEYNLEKDNDSFIDKTIIHFMGLIGRIKRDDQKETGLLYEINPMLKLISTIVLIAFLSMSKEPLYTYLIAAYFLVSLATLNGEILKRIVLLSIIVPILTLIILIPSMIMGNIYNSLMIVFKIMITLIGVNILSNTTAWHDITKAFKILFISDIFILVFDITIRYIFLLGEFSLEMLYALKLRSVGKNKNKVKAVTNIMGNLFFKTKSMGEDMYSAMECRGFTGEYVSYKKFRFTLKDAIYLIITIAIIVIFFIY